MVLPAAAAANSTSSVLRCSHPSPTVMQLEMLNMDPTFLNRNVNEGFSGGEKKRNEILQLAVLEVGATEAVCLCVCARFFARALTGRVPLSFRRLQK
eukprot:1160907-Pelagomonas_calceolata.AAC.6